MGQLCSNSAIATSRVVTVTTLIATDADNLFRGIERSLRAQHVLEGQHVEFETYMLEEKLRIGGRGYNDYCNRMKNIHISLMTCVVSPRFVKGILLTLKNGSV
ncbi:uncharacterized protein LOC107609450 isoform X3 [Arachis ipaensis]|uniref:uncharacterized protein LOC107609450 isoform X3 n=1 Tax=Arachis ipaensis TaxID=130454 RepID=UPI0007AF2815|nr:uncharacterized protein LOC107609450 isoform X3 [Arachis ipaensis]